MCSAGEVPLCWEITGAPGKWLWERHCFTDGLFHVQILMLSSLSFLNSAITQAQASNRQWLPGRNLKQRPSSQGRVHEDTPPPISLLYFLQQEESWVSQLQGENKKGSPQNQSWNLLVTYDLWCILVELPLVQPCSKTPLGEAGKEGEYEYV